MTLVTALTALGAICAVAGLALRRAPRVWTLLTVLSVGLALALVWFDEGIHATSHPFLTLVAGVAAVTGGGLVTTQVFALVDRDSRDSRVRHSGEILRGGAWIGALERLGVYVALVAGWAPGLALVLAVKGLGRYPELRNQEDTGAAERFIIGTFTSVLWAAACVGISVLAS
jgi:hypothetical protein